MAINTIGRNPRTPQLGVTKKVGKTKFRMKARNLKRVPR